MNTNFSRTLSLLRKEKGISQKEVAAKLGISQALLSHYENGVREPGLSFVVAAADFYEVSSDFMLGRTMSRDGTGINMETIYDDGITSDKRQPGSAMTVFSKKILVNSIGVLFDMLGKLDNSGVIKEAYNYLGTAIYKLFRIVYIKAGNNPEAFFAVPTTEFSDSADSALKLAEMRFKRAVVQTNETGKLSNDSLTREYPLLYQSLFSMIHASEKEMNDISEKVKRS